MNHHQNASDPQPLTAEQVDRLLTPPNIADVVEAVEPADSPLIVATKRYEQAVRVEAWAKEALERQKDRYAAACQTLEDVTEELAVFHRKMKL
jgi:hypothetical protein